MSASINLKVLSIAVLVGMSLVGCSDNDDDTPPIIQEQKTGSIALKVFDNDSGDQLKDAEVSVIKTTLNTKSNAEGIAKIEKVPVGRSILQISKAGYADQVIVVNLAEKQDLSGVVVQLIPLELGGSIVPTTGGTINLANSTAQVVIPANGLRRVDGQAIQGNVNVSIALINTAQEIRNMPGDLATVVNNNRAPLESFGAMVVDLRDSSGAKVTLVQNQFANIRIPLMTRGTAPTTIPLYYFDPALGYWLQDGSQQLTLEKNAAGEFFYTGRSSTLNTVNADIPYATTQVSGCLNDEQGKRVAHAQILLEGKDYSGYSLVNTNANGEFTIDAKQNSTVLIGGQFNALRSNTVEQEVKTANLSLNQCLVLTEASQNVTVRLSWGKNPIDVDSHLFAPDGSHVYFEDQGALLQHPFVNLDIDDVDSYGPEIVTINKLMVGDYQYLVHNYSGTNQPGIFGSPIKVELNTPKGTQIFTPASVSGETELWHAFKLTVADNCEITVTPVKKWLSDSPNFTSRAVKYCTKS